MGNTLKRYNSVRRADDLDDQQGTAAIQGAVDSSQTQEQLQVFLLSRLRQIIFGESAPGHHWYDDLFSDGILSLRELSSTNTEAAVVRVGVPLVGAKDGRNRVFKTSPEHFVHDPGGSGKTIELWHNGRRLAQTGLSSPEFGDYTVLESGGIGTGFDTIKLLTFSPVGSSSLLANYQRAIS
jgi:hypothetical protein